MTSVYVASASRCIQRSRRAYASLASLSRRACSKCRSGRGSPLCSCSSSSSRSVGSIVRLRRCAFVVSPSRRASSACLTRRRRECTMYSLRAFVLVDSSTLVLSAATAASSRRFSAMASSRASRSCVLYASSSVLVRWASSCSSCMRCSMSMRALRRPSSIPSSRPRSKLSADTRCRSFLNFSSRFCSSVMISERSWATSMLRRSRSSSMSCAW
mmetsp:Transcript_37998/g.117408  ORF Transcript_37998/g.117408 Transcript_37998/m.117408 type:complete len:214 (-) Transcript_37998:105-746(-)